MDVGDTVKFTKTYNNIAKGTVTTIRALDEDGLPILSLDPEKDDYGWSRDLLEVIKPAKPNPESPTLRDQFAMSALTGLCGNCDSTGMWQWTPAAVAARAYEIVSEMMAERERGK